MQNAEGGGIPAQFDGRNDSYRSIASDLISLVERVQESMKLIESAIAAETPSGNQEFAASVIVLDDVTPRYARAQAALNASNARLGDAVHCLLDIGTPPAADGPYARPTLCSVSRA